MVKKPTPKPASKKAGTGPADRRKAVFEALFGLTADRGWREPGLGDIAEAAGLGLADLHALYPSKTAILWGFMRHVDGAVLAGIDADMRHEPVRDRLFDILMRRFDVLAPYKEGLGAIARGAACDPVAGACLSLGLGRSLAIMLEAAGVNSAGLRGLVRIKGLGAIYLSALRVWLHDDSEDLARTMAALDRSLARAEGLLGMIPLRRRRAGADARPEAA